MPFHRCLCLLAALVVALGPVRTRAENPAPAGAGNPVAANAAPAAATESHPANYELSPGDNVAVTVFREPDLFTVQRLSRDGTINFPLIGVVKLAGKNTNEAAAHLAGLLSKGYLVHPQVSVLITEYERLKFTVLGQVRTPGAFEVPADRSLDLLAAVAHAGGFTRVANQSNILVRRTVNGQEETLKVDAKRLMNDRQSPRFLVKPNDIISVGESLF